MDKCNCDGWLEYTDTDADETGSYDVYCCVECGKEYHFYTDGAVYADNNNGIFNEVLNG